jgi:hypothetical protein
VDAGGAMTIPEIHYAVEMMLAHGGSFVRKLAEAWQAADPINKQILEAAFPLIFVQYGLWEDDK